MILNRISLENFISHKKTNLDLDYGINVVIGPNGAGKTAILDAISFALFCDYSNRGKKENLINNKAKNCKASLNFSEGGIEYSVEWTIKRTGSPKGKLYRKQDNKKMLLAHGGAHSIIPEIEKILALDKSMFLQSVYVRQGEIEKLVIARPSERKELISKLLNIEDLEKAYEKIKQIIDDYIKKQIVLKTELKQKPTLETEKQQYVTTSTSLEKEINQKKDELRKLKELIAELKEKIKILKANKKKFGKLESKKQILENQVGHIKEKFGNLRLELRKSLQSEIIVNGLEKEIEKLGPLESFSKTLSKKNGVELKLESLQKELKTLDEVSEIFESSKEEKAQYNQTKKRQEQILKERENYEGSQVVWEKSLKDLSKIRKNKGNLESSLKKLLDRYQEILEEQVTIENIESLLDKKQQELQWVIEQNRKHLDDIKSNMALLKKRNKDLENNLSTLNPLDPSSKTCPTCETELSTKRITQLGQKFNEEKSQIPEQIKKLRKELKVLEKTRKKHEEIRDKTNSIEPERFTELTGELTETKHILEEKQNEVKELEKRTILVKKLDEKLSDIEKRIAKLEEPNLKFESAKIQLERLRTREQIEEEIKPLNEELKEADSCLENAISKLGYTPEKPEEELEQLRQKKQEYDQNLPIAKLKDNLEAGIITTEKNLIEQQDFVSQTVKAIHELNYSETEHENKETDLEHQVILKNEQEKIIEGKKSEKKTADIEAKNRDVKLALLTNKAEEKKGLDNFVRLLNNIRKAYGKDGIQKMIRARAGPLLERATRAFFERFNLAYSDIKLDDDYNISIIGPAGEQDIDQISGGERVALAIALRLAIAQVLSGRVETIIMDEPTTHLDETRRKELVSILNSFFREGGRIIPQMLIISHHREIEDVADVIYSVKKDEYSIVKTGFT